MSRERLETFGLFSTDKLVTGSINRLMVTINYRLINDDNNCQLQPCSASGMCFTAIYSRVWLSSSKTKFRGKTKKLKQKVSLCTGNGTFLTSAGLLAVGIKDRKKRNEVSDEMKMMCNQNWLQLCSTFLIISLSVKMNL